MKRISTALKEIIKQNDFLSFGLSNGLLNLSQTAVFLKPYIEARTKKQVKETALLMGLSRLSREMAINRKSELDGIKFIINFSIRTNICALTFYNNSKIRQQLNDFYPLLKGHKSYFAQNQGINELSIIIDESILDTLKSCIKEKPKSLTKNLVSVDVQLSEECYQISGVIERILAQVALQGVNVYEVSSTYTELIFYVDQKDIKLTIDTLCSINGVSFKLEEKVTNYD